MSVGGDHLRGVVAAASYEAQKYGVRSAMAQITAKKKRPGLIFVYPRFEVYCLVLKQILRIFKEYADLIEPLSPDEAIPDVTMNKKNITSEGQLSLDFKNND